MAPATLVEDPKPPPRLRRDAPTERFAKRLLGTIEIGTNVVRIDDHRRGRFHPPIMAAFAMIRHEQSYG
jgi:hypothetical protein